MLRDITASAKRALTRIRSRDEIRIPQFSLEWTGVDVSLARVLNPNRQHEYLH
jgi:hypothetical protein